MNLMKAIATVGGLTGLSRIAGFVRDILTASIMGAGPVADAFFVALKLPNFFRRVTAEGAFSVSFLPLYTENIEQDGEDAAAAFASNVFSIMLWTLLAVTILALFAMPWIVRVIAPGFSDDPLRYSAAIELARITFPYLLLMSLSALAGGILNAHDRFAPFAAAPILFNLSLIVALLSAGLFETAGHAMAYGVLVAGFLQCGLLFLCLKRMNLSVRLVRPVFSVRIKRLFKLMGPGVVGAGVVHINLFADLIIASLLDTGSISRLYYADRLNQLPLGIVGIAIGTALLPMLSRAIAAGHKEEASSLFNRSMEISLLFTAPAAIGLFVIAQPIISTLFEHGAFEHADTLVTSSVLAAYAIGLPAYVMAKVFSASFWSLQDTSTPVKISIIATLTNIALSLCLIFYFDMGVRGIAMATSFAGWLQLVMLWRAIQKKTDLRFDAKLKTNAVKIVCICAVLSGVLMGLNHFVLVSYFAQAEIWGRIGGLAAVIGISFAVYGGGVLITRVITADELKRYLTR